MLKHIKNATLDIISFPRDINSEIKEFDTHTLILINGTYHIDRQYSLPGNLVLKDDKESYKCYGIKVPDRNILVVVYGPFDEPIEPADLDYYSNLDDFTYFCTMRHEEHNTSSIFKPINNLVSKEPLTKSGHNILEFKSSVHGHSVFVKEGSNRHKFISGESDFFDDPLDFYAPRDTIMKPDQVVHYAKSKQIWPEELLIERLENHTLTACITLFASKDMIETAQKAIELRNKLPGKLTKAIYWAECEDPQEAKNFNYTDIDWDKVANYLSDYVKGSDEAKMTNNADGYYHLSELIGVRCDSTGWGTYNMFIFTAFYALLSDEKIDYITNTFKLKIEG